MNTLLDEKAAKAVFSTSSDENVNLAMIWLNRCLKSHAACTISTHPLAPLPTRVLDVAASDTHDGIRLRYGKGIFSPYITLSHVWGSEPIITTKKSTLNDRLTSISMKSLTQTFRDSVTVARNMSVQYLWIDSLCIIQDSAEDWAAESARMGEYYGNSLFTIAAVWAIGGGGGCFARRDPLELSPCRVRIQFPENVRISGQRQFLRPTTSWDTAGDTVNFQRPPLWQRAWVLQERLLSRRILQFSDIQLSWRCRTEEASERAPEGFPRRKQSEYGDSMVQEAITGFNYLGSPENPGNFGTWPQTTGSLGANPKLADIYNAWYDLVMLYGRCNLTKPSDIFPAISSLAAGLGKVIGDTYLAGLWQRDLYRGLLWSAPNSTKMKDDMRCYRAPSWSWASLSGACSFIVRQIYLKADATPVITIKDVILAASTPALGSYGELSDGILTFTGLLKRAHPKGIEGENIFYAIAKDSDEVALFDLQEQRVVGYYYPDNKSRAALSEVWCCPVLTKGVSTKGVLNVAKAEMEKGGQLAQAYGLVLYPLDQRERIYMRVGLTWITDFSWFKGIQAVDLRIV